jgi:hypothetical protein
MRGRARVREVSSPAVLRKFASAIRSGETVLFTGAGFSAGARDTTGARLPDSRRMRRELWSLAFGTSPIDHSSLSDIYAVALERCPRDVATYLQSRLTVGARGVPAHLAAWLAPPWRRVYTLNVDDFERAVSRAFELPHALSTVSALGKPARASKSSSEIEVVHLNGLVRSDGTRVTFSPLQYAERLCARQEHYERLAAELMKSSVVFVGTTLDEIFLWQHLMLRYRKMGRRRRPPSFVVSTSLPIARAELLRSVGIHWVKCSARAAAERFLTMPKRRRLSPNGSRDDRASRRRR